MRADLELSLDLIQRAGHPFFFCKYKNSTPFTGVILINVIFKNNTTTNFFAHS